MITEKERDTLNLIRWLSTISIVICHLFQRYDLVAAYIFNIGVQVFFFLSGFLYGNKRIIKPLSFYKSRITKLYIPYAIWVAIAACSLKLIVESHTISSTDWFLQMIMLKNLPGLNHLWFMRVIFLCYFILPFVDWCLTQKKSFFLVTLSLMLGLMIYINYHATLLWIGVYFAGYLCGRYPNLQKSLGVISVMVVLYLLLRAPFHINLFKEPSVQNDLLHAFGGICIFLLIYKNMRHIEFNRKLSLILNKGGGYEIYLTHHLFIIGPLSILYITPFPVLNILIVIIITLFSSYWLNKISQILQIKKPLRLNRIT